MNCLPSRQGRVLVAAFLNLVLLSGDVLPAAPGQQAGARLRTTSRVVLVSVVATDKAGHPLTGLQAQDFEVLDEGKAQPISFFAFAGSASPSEAAPALPPGTFTNRVERERRGLSSATVVLFDLLNTRATDQAQARRQLVEFLRGVKPTDNVALYFLGRGLRVAHDFTHDPAELVRAAQGQPNELSVRLMGSEIVEPDTGEDVMDNLVRYATREITQFHIRNRVNLTVAALETIARHLSRLPGRKNLVWISGGFPFGINLSVVPAPNAVNIERRVFEEEIQRAVRALTAADVAIYPIDARGMLDPSGGDPNFNRARRSRPDPSGNTATDIPEVVDASRPGTGTPTGNPRAPIATMQSISQEIVTMETLADDTGGLAAYNTNDFAAAIRRAADDAEATYVLGYVPTHNKWNDKFRRIEVKLKRTGVGVRFRRGYYAFADKPLDPKQRQAILTSASAGALDATEIGITAQIVSLDRATSRLSLSIQVDPRDLRFDLRERLWAGSFDLLVAQIDAKGAVNSGEAEHSGLEVPEDRYAQFVTRGIILQRHVNLLPETTQVRIAVVDPASGALGSLTVPVP